MKKRSQGDNKSERKKNSSPVRGKDYNTSVGGIIEKKERLSRSRAIYGGGSSQNRLGKTAKRKTQVERKERSSRVNRRTIFFCGGRELPPESGLARRDSLPRGQGETIRRKKIHQRTKEEGQETSTAGGRG